MSLILGIVIFGLLGAAAVYGYKTSIEEAERFGARKPSTGMPSAPPPADNNSGA